jgi:hypothetical protein
MPSAEAVSNDMIGLPGLSCGATTDVTDPAGFLKHFGALTLGQCFPRL